MRCLDHEHCCELFRGQAAILQRMRSVSVAVIDFITASSGLNGWGKPNYRRATLIAKV
jgi:hypothetical protein